ncbi:MAG: hypothetical protein A2X94_09160 [Bdellovibrionales bacterium GWB1_55_8]|nr:MAG: hypothetical protein A2X94_09160 [Bdellovibrionales bacterium GWB1_55_8]
MNYSEHEKEILVLDLKKTMVALIVRFSDGVDEIQAAFESVLEAGEIMSAEVQERHFEQKTLLLH